jgi:hypothetical protein
VTGYLTNLSGALRNIASYATALAEGIDENINNVNKENETNG